MTLNFPGPYELRIFYSVDARDHVQKFNVDLTADPDVGTAFSSILAVTKGGGTENLAQVVSDYVGLAVNFLSDTDASFDYAELWKITPFSFDGVYRAAHVIAESGVNATATGPANQVTMTFRTQEGGSARMTLLDTVDTGWKNVSYSQLGAGTAKDLFDYLFSSNSVFLGRDTSYFDAPVKYLVGQNERLFKRVYRS